MTFSAFNRLNLIAWATFCLQNFRSPKFITGPKDNLEVKSCLSRPIKVDAVKFWNVKKWNIFLQKLSPHSKPSSTDFRKNRSDHAFTLKINCWINWIKQNRHLYVSVFCIILYNLYILLRPTNFQAKWSSILFQLDRSTGYPVYDLWTVSSILKE